MVNKIFPITNISIFIIIIFLCYFLLSEKDLSKMKQIIPFYNFYIKNKSAFLIKSIEVADSNNNCPQNSKSLNFYKYPGTKEGCLKSKTDLEEGSCSIWTKIFFKYENIEETEEKNFDVLFSKKLCAFPYDSNDYVKNIKNLNNEGKNKRCGFLDTKGNEYYVDNDKDCPINNIIINNEKTNDNNIFTTLELIKDQYYLHFSNAYIDNNKNYLLTNESLIISEGLPCINPGEINTYHLQYLLNKENESYICNTSIKEQRLDSRYNEISSINKNTLYKDNNINLDNFHNYPFKEVELNLYQLGYIRMDTNFISNILDNSDKFISDINTISDYNKYNKHIIPLIFSFIFLVIVNLIFKYFIADITIYILSFILLAFNIGYLTLNILIFFSLKNFNSLDEYYSNDKNDEIFNNQLKYIDDIINNSKNINIKNIVGICLINFLIFFFDVINFCIFNNPNNSIIKTKRNINYYFQNKKIYNSINVLKPFEEKKENKIKFKKEIELSKINNINSEDDDNIKNSSNDEEENDILTNE